jgi:lipopolysaccharide export system permease protein
MLIITRYLFREVLTTMTVVLGILLLIFISNEFVRFLARAATGKLSSMTVLKIILMQVPYLAGLLLPASLYVGFLLAYGRMYAESEMTVLTACGMSRSRLLYISMLMAFVVIIVDSFLTFYISPQLAEYKDKLLAMSGPATLIQTVQPGKFMSAANGDIVYYIENISRNHDKMKNLFIAQRDKPAPAGAPGGDNWNITSAKIGYTTVNAKTNQQWLVAQNGYRYFGAPGNAHFQIIKFGEYGARIGVVMKTGDVDSAKVPTSELWHTRNNNPDLQGEWQWRISVPLSIPILTLLAVPLSNVRPRQGRYGKLLPALLIYAAYVNTMFVARGWLQDGKVPFFIGMWWLHILLLLVALSLWVNKQKLLQWLHVRKAA